MNKREELRRLLRGAARALESRPAGHLSEDELIAYQERQLAEAEREKVQAHLAECGECIEMFRIVDRFLRPPEEGEEPISPERVAQAWASVQRRVRTTAVRGDFTSAP